ncbi:hypothetical protein TNCV_4751751 [Trichonephila clavipes]|nr:hypothetical protein TNCV_4751751 [Trichonephila clavipes]
MPNRPTTWTYGMGCHFFDRRTPLSSLEHTYSTAVRRRHSDNCFATFLCSTLALFFEQDNVKLHTARVSMNCFKACQTLPWPARISPIEHVRYYLKVTASTGNVMMIWPTTIGANLARNTTGDHQGALSLYTHVAWPLASG